MKDTLCAPTEYVKALDEGNSIDKNGMCKWWLRSTLEFNPFDFTAKNEGFVEYCYINGSRFVGSYGVRLAMWINIGLDSKD